MDNVINATDIFNILTEKQEEILNMSHNETRSALLELIFEIIRKVSELPNISEEPHINKSSWIKCSDKLPDSFCNVLMHWEDDDIPDTIGVYAGTGVLGEMCFRANGLRQYPNSYIIVPEESKESD